MVQELFGRAMTIFRDPTTGLARRAAFDVAGMASSIVRNGRCRPEKGEIPSGTGRRAPYSAACGSSRASASLVSLASALFASSRFFGGRTDGKPAGAANVPWISSCHSLRVRFHLPAAHIDGWIGALGGRSIGVGAGSS